MGWQLLNHAPDHEARAAFSKCCGSRRWVAGMMARRPFDSWPAVLAAAEEVEAELERSDWLEAFAAHPEIGDVASLREKYAATAAWSTAEQAGVGNASEQAIMELADGNQRYKSRFGHIFIVCAAGKSADEMLQMLQARLCNEVSTELQIAVAEQKKITRLRLEKL